MIKAGILSVGTEIMKGKIENTNASNISRWLNNLGIITRFHLSVQDINSDIIKALQTVNDCELIIITGGLGPTDDDLTREAVAEYFGKKIIYDEQTWKLINKFFTKANLPVYESNKKQAMLIEDGEFIENKRGTAPGIFLKVKEKLIFLLPGPPVENQPMLNEYIINKLIENKFLEGKLYSKEIRLFNSGESRIADLFKNLKTDCEIGYYFSQEGYLEIIVSKQGKDELKIKKEVDAFFAEIEKLLKENGIFYTENIDINTTVLSELINKNLTISFAESITGGNISGTLVKIPDASKILKGSIVAYSNEVKKNILKVNEKTLKTYGAVSAECVKEMAFGLQKIMNTDICISISGIAGPAGGSGEKPVGLVHFGFLLNGEFYSKKELFIGSRIRIINRCINYVFVEILNKIRN